MRLAAIMESHSLFTSLFMINILKILAQKKCVVNSQVILPVILPTVIQVQKPNKHQEEYPRLRRVNRIQAPAE